jgi:hypothetical protein
MSKIAHRSGVPSPGCLEQATLEPNRPRGRRDN